MKLLMQSLSVLLMAVFLQACQLGEDDEDDGTVEIKYLTTNDVYGTTVSNSRQYELILQADNNIATLKDDIAEISIKGELNTLTIYSDTLIESITITGNDNTIEVESGVNLTVTDLTILGNGNNVVVHEFTNTPTISAASEGVANIVCETNTSVSVCL